MEGSPMDEWIAVGGVGGCVQPALLSSILEQEGIPCALWNKGVQNLFGVGTIGAGYNLIVGPIKLASRRSSGRRRWKSFATVDNAAREFEEREPAREKRGGDWLIRNAGRAVVGF